MTERNYSANAKRTTLLSAVTDPAATSIVITDDSATLNYPAVPFTIVVDKGTQSEEIMTVTNVSGTTLTVTRAPEGNAATTHSAGAAVAHAVTARDFVDSQTHVYDSAAVHGVTGSVVGTTDTQTLTNKTIVSPTITGGTSDFSPIGTIVAYGGSTAPNGWLLCDGTAYGPRATGTYAPLYNVIGITYGGGDGSTTFQVPNLKGKVPVGVDAAQTEFASRNISAGNKATQVHSHTIQGAGAHGHSFASDGGHGHTITDGAGSHSHTTGGSSHSYVDSYYLGTTSSGQGGGAQRYVTWNPILGLSGTDHTHGTDAQGGHNHSVNSGGSHGHSFAAATDHQHTATDFGTGAASGSVAGNLQPYLTVNYIIKY